MRFRINAMTKLRTALLLLALLALFPVTGFAQATTQTIAGPLAATAKLTWTQADLTNLAGFTVVTDGVAADVGLPTPVAGVYSSTVPPAGRPVGNHIFVVLARNALGGSNASAEHQVSVVNPTDNLPQKPLNLRIQGQLDNAMASLNRARALILEAQRLVR